jgi:SAM-dependent methyltransferase
MLLGCHDNILFKASSRDGFPNMDRDAYDVIVSNFVIHWIKERQAALRNIFTSMKPGGRLVMTYPCREMITSSSNLFHKWLTEATPLNSLKSWLDPFNMTSLLSVY